MANGPEPFFMKTLLFVAASALTLATAACAPTAKPDLRTALDCPANQGDLTRTNKAADGKTCTYTSSEGAEVSLQLVAVKGDAAATLQGIEDAIAPPAIRSAAAQASDTADAAKDVAGAAKDAADAARDAAKDAAATTREAAQDAGRSANATVSAGDKDDWNADRKDHKDGVDIRIDGKGHKIVSGDGDSAQVDLPGIHISAKDNDADVRIGGIRINANDDESTVHIIRDVRLRGEALSRTKRGIRATFIATNRAEPNGYRFVGYEAAGPKTGPLTVAVVKAKTEINHDNDLARDIKRLVRHNGGA
jgi:hypothetical protein